MSGYHNRTRALFASQHKDSDDGPPEKTQPSSPRTYSVSQVVYQVSQKLKHDIPQLSIRGEISSLKRWRTGHWYFNIQDEKSVLPCVMFRNANAQVAFDVKDGTEVIITARLGLYEPQARFQATVLSMEPVGTGRLLKELEERRKHFWQKGYFDVAHKRSLPRVPQRIALITSPQGAALKDMMRIFVDHRVPCEFRLFPSLVQGQEAPKALIKALIEADRDNAIDVIILTRGGGALEDLIAFSDPQLIEAIFHAQTPIIVGVGHEPDRMLADDVADIRCATPTHCAQHITQHFSELLGYFHQQQDRLSSLMSQHIQVQHERLFAQRLQLRKPREALAISRDRLLTGRHRLQSSLQTVLMRHNQGIDLASMRLQNSHPKHILERQIQRLSGFQDALSLTAIQRRIALQNILLAHRFQSLSQATTDRVRLTRAGLMTDIERLEARSPLKILAAGFAHVQHPTKGPIRSVHHVEEGDRLIVTWTDGQIGVEVVDRNPSIRKSGGHGKEESEV